MMCVVENCKDHESLPCSEMGVCEVGILTTVPGGNHLDTIGDPIIRVCDEWFFPVSDTWEADVEGYHYRDLQPNERIVISRESDN